MDTKPTNSKESRDNKMEEYSCNPEVKKVIRPRVVSVTTKSGIFSTKRGIILHYFEVGKTKLSDIKSYATTNEHTEVVFLLAIDAEFYPNEFLDLIFSNGTKITIPNKNIVAVEYGTKSEGEE